MKVLGTTIVFDRGELMHSEEWARIYGTYEDAIKGMVNPPGNDKFVLRRKARVGKKGQWLRNGVGPIKRQFMDAVEARGWILEKPLDLSDLLKTAAATEDPFIGYPSKQRIPEELRHEVGALDCYFGCNGWRAVIEWETGNVSSSHRSMNKLCLALMARQAEVCVLIVPSRAMYEHLTDRIGNWMELNPYLGFWKMAGANVKTGLLAVSVVEQDALTDDPVVPYIKAGKDGRSAEGKAKLKQRRLGLSES